MNSIAKDVIYLASCAVNRTIPEKTRVDGMDFPAVYNLASRHMITAMVAFALESAGNKDKRSGNAIAVAVRKTASFDNEWSAIRARLEDAGIWYLPLKGAVLKSMYPKYGMREFADYDILFDADCAEDVKAIMVERGYDPRRFGSGIHDCYYKDPIFNFEMHRALFRPSYEEKLYEYYRDVQGRLIGDGYEKHLSPEDFYIYMVAHEYKHYSARGTGLRSLLDTYVYLVRCGERLDMHYLQEEADKLGISDFEAANRSLAQHLFAGEELTAADQEMLGYILTSGTYGTVEQLVSNKVRKLGGGMLGKAKYLLSRMFPPMESIKSDYPFFYNHKILLPVLFFYRIRKALTLRRRIVMTELKTLVNKSK